MLVLCSLTLGAAQAVAQPSTAPVPTYAMPPVPDPLLHPTAAPIAPDSPTARTNVECVKASPGTPGEIKAPPWAQAQLRFADAWPLSRGAGVRVAVIDTGVNPHPRLGARLEPGGDYVSNTPGTTDCDGHGTIVAGIIAASADPTERTSFAGVAPYATLISIRQTSKYYDEVAKGSGDEPGYGNLSTLARSVVRAVDLKAKVINISEAACGPATKVLNDGALGAALKYAVDNDVVIVAAAGNTGSTDAGSCKNQNATNPAQPGVPGKSPVATIASPAWYSDYVLAVGAMARDGTASKFSLAGPWVGVAGPGEDITSLDPAPGSVGLSNRLAETPGAQLGPIQGTSFAAPYVAGTAALVRARFPSLSANRWCNGSRSQPTPRPVAGRRRWATAWWTRSPPSRMCSQPRAPHSRRGTAPRGYRLRWRRKHRTRHRERWPLPVPPPRWPWWYSPLPCSTPRDATDAAPTVRANEAQWTE